MSADPSISAADPRQSAWVAANAGAGKTHTLANRVTRLLLADADPAKILCLTFTKAAAAEMQHRLFRQLGEWAMLPDAELSKKIADIGADLGGPEELKKARRLFAKALETPGGLKILTIHAFCQNLLSRFPLEAGVPASFKVLDDQTSRELMAQSRTRVLERAGEGDALRAAALAHLLTETSEARLQSVLDAALGTDRRKLDRYFESLGAEQDALRRSLRRAHGAEETLGATEIVAAFCLSLQAEEQTLRAAVAWLAGGTKTDAAAAEKLAGALERKFAVEAFEHFRDFFLTGKGEPRKTLATKKLIDASPALFAQLTALAERFLNAETRRRAAYAAGLAEAALTIADAVRREYATAKRNRGALDYDDLIIETLKLLKQSDAAAWVLHKLDGGLDHILIDEAQDTSPEQWEIVRKLTEEFFAGEGSERAAVRTVFAVGDEKQSIFSFQGADPRQFDVNRRFFIERASAAGRMFADEPLTTSRRSAPEVLSFVDTVFEPLAARGGLTSDGADVRHTALRDTAKGRVELWPTLKPSKDPEPDYWHPIDVQSEASPVVQLAIQLARQIEQWIGKVKLPGHDDAIKAGDIMILLPRREPFGTEIIRQLKERRVPVAGADRIRLTEQIAIMDLIALGRFVLLPEDDYNLAALLRSPLCAIGEEELFALSYQRKGTLWSALRQRRDETPALAAVQAFLSEMFDRADFAPPFEFYSHALIVHGQRLRLLQRLGHEAGDAIDEFLSLSFAYESANTPSLEGFLHWVERGGAEIKRDMERGRDEVRVMTVHGAKGLEADIVILPDTAAIPEAITNKGHLLYTDDGVLFPMSEAEAPETVKAAKAEAQARVMEEHRRLLYVALTRAKDRLYVCGFEGKNGVRPGSWYALARDAAEKIGIDLVRGDATIKVLGEATDEAAAPARAGTAKAVEKPDWLGKEGPRDAPSPRLIRPFDAAGVEEPPVFSPLESNKRFRRGLLVHTLLARLPEIAPAGRFALAQKYLHTQKLDEKEAASLIAEILAVLDDPVFAPAFTPQSRAEVAIVADLPELGAGARVNGRIDRLAETPDEVLIVDFKTNRPPPSSESDVPTLYATQMALYRAAAVKIFPGRRIVCGLVWTDGPTLMKLSNDLLDAELGRIRTRLDPEGRRS
ncbi:MAG: double-strand break repair helicase AddA [Rhizomicrobium sp.]